MKGSILKRLEDLEARYKQDPLIVLASTDSGEEVKITMRECLEREDTHFIKVIAGANLEDLDLFLKAMREEAERQAHGSGTCGGGKHLEGERNLPFRAYGNCTQRRIYAGLYGLFRNKGNARRRSGSRNKGACFFRA